MAVIADEACAIVALQRLLDDRVARLFDVEGGAVVNVRTHIALLDSQLGEPRVVVELGESGARCRQCLLLGEDVFRKRGKNIEFERERAALEARCEAQVAELQKQQVLLYLLVITQYLDLV